MKNALSLLRAVPVWVWVILALCVALAGQSVRLADARADAADVRQKFSEYRETQERQARQALDTLRRDAARTALKRQEAADADYLARRAAEADAARLRATAGQLQRYATDLATSLGDQARGAAAAGSCPATQSAGILADMVGELDRFAERAAVAADEARRAGQFCERSYDALKVP
ncbi:MAG: DUF2514 family protein [Burkholderiales bacterium]|nr:MAG: DUF2514 family protein [Burkholderiales bacterium]